MSDIEVYNIGLHLPSLGKVVEFLARIQPPNETLDWFRSIIVFSREDDSPGYVLFSREDDSPGYVLCRTDREWSPQEIQQAETDLFQGRQNDDHDDFSYEDCFPASELFLRVKLKPKDQIEAATSSLLLIPTDSSPAALSELMISLCELGAIVDQLTGILGTQEDTLLFKVSKIPIHQLYGLPSLPRILLSYKNAPFLFFPEGVAHPFSNHFRGLLPAGDSNVMHLWAQDRPEARLVYQEFRVSFTVPLASNIELTPMVSPKLEVQSVAETPSIGLTLNKGYTPRKPEQVSGVIYRYRSTDERFGPAFLEVLDHIEAGLDSIYYFSNSENTSPDPEDNIEHFMWVRRGLPSEASWPEFDRYDGIPGFDSLGFNLFVPAGYRFVPDIEGMLAGENGKTLLKNLQAVLKLGENFKAESDVVLLEPRRDQQFAAIVLRGGRLLEQSIEIILPDIHFDPLRQVVGTVSIDSETRNLEVLNRWGKSGEETSQRLQAATLQLIKELENQIHAVDGQVTEAERRLEVAQNCLYQAHELEGDVRLEFDAFCERALTLIHQIIEPRLEWFHDVDERQTRLAEIQESCRQALENADARVLSLSQEVGAMQMRLDASRQRLETHVNELNGQHEQFRSGISYAEAEAGQAEAQLAQCQKRCAIQMAELDIRRQELSTFEAEVTQLERQVAARQQGIEQAFNQATKQRKDAIDLESRLDVMEHRTPLLIQKAEQLSSVNSHRKSTVENGFQASRSAWDKAQSDSDKLDKKERELEGEREALKERIIGNQSKTSKNRSLQTEVGALNIKKRSLQSERTSLTQEIEKLTQEIQRLEKVSTDKKSQKKSLQKSRKPWRWWK